MKSIQGKFVLLVTIGILLCIAVAGGLGVWTARNVQTESSGKILSLTCANQAYEFDQTLLGIQDAVDGCAAVVQDDVGKVSQLSNREWLNSYLEKSEQLVESMARYLSGVCTFYLRFEPSLANPNAGFFYTKLGRDIKPTKEKTLTDILAFNEDDTEHVGWYYQPRNAGKPLWLEPYYNKNIGVNMVSYVVPMYVDGTFIGVVGMDVDFDVVVSMARHIKPYESADAALVSSTGKVYYHGAYDAGTQITDELPELEGLVGELATLKHGQCSSIATYSQGGSVRRCVASPLCNGMYLVISVDKGEIDEPANRLLIRTLAIGVCIMVVVIASSIVVSRRITRPLTQLADVAHAVAQGDLDVTIPQAEDDEVGVLAHAFETTVSSLRSYIDKVNEKAYRDSLTLVKNKAAYRLAEEQINEQIGEGPCEFGLVMMDVNGLKGINDSYGHQRGDEYLQANCRLICHVYAHSPVYRIGGDEFVVVLRGSDYVRRDALYVALKTIVEQRVQDQEPWLRVSLAAGMAVFEEGDASVEDVFARADEAMYEDKRKTRGIKDPQDARAGDE